MLLTRTVIPAQAGMTVLVISSLQLKAIGPQRGELIKRTINNGPLVLKSPGSLA
jgi:hypothetical protein